MKRQNTQPPLQLAALWQSLGIALLAVVAIGSLAPISIGSGGSTIPHLDKLLHFLAYGLLTGWYLAVFPPQRRRWVIPAGFLAFGLSMEALQGTTGYRNTSLGDGLANLSGIVLAVWLLPRPLQATMRAIEARLIRHRQRRLRHLVLWQLLGAHFAIGLLLTAFLPIEVGRLPLPHADKLLHFAVWGTLTAWFLLAFPGRKRGYLVPLAMLALSVTLESLQALTPLGGEPSAFDVLADIVGIAVACVIVIFPLRRLLLGIERRLFPRPRHRRRRRVQPIHVR